MNLCVRIRITNTKLKSACVNYTKLKSACVNYDYKYKTQICVRELGLQIQNSNLRV